MTPEKARSDVFAVLEFINEAVIDHVNKSPMGVPSGHLYTALMSHMDLETYEILIGKLITAGKIRKQGHLLLKA